jgi:hypothetical protein
MSCGTSTLPRMREKRKIKPFLCFSFHISVTFSYFSGKSVLRGFGLVESILIFGTSVSKKILVPRVASLALWIKRNFRKYIHF